MITTKFGQICLTDSKKTIVLKKKYDNGGQVIAIAPGPLGPGTISVFGGMHFFCMSWHKIIQKVKTFDKKKMNVK